MSHSGNERDPLYGTDNQALCIAYYDIFMTILCLCNLLSMIPAIYTITRDSKQISDNKCLHYLGIALFISVFLTLILVMTGSLSICHNFKLFQLFVLVFTQFYVISLLLLLAFLFYRLYSVFSESALALSKLTIAIWCMLYLIAVCTGITSAVAFANYEQWKFVATVLIGFSYSMDVLLMAFINVLFIAKIVKVFRNVDSDQALIDVITKTSLLAFVSTFFSLLVALIVLISPYAPSFYMGCLRALLFVSDCMTNVWCTLLSYRHFDAWYKKLCCDSKCRRLWYRMLRRDRDEVMMSKDLETQKSTSVSVST